MSEMMRSNVSITVAEDTLVDAQSYSPSKATSGIGELRPLGFVIKYGVNTIPYAVLDLGPDALGMVCDIEKYRRHPIKIKVKSTEGCLVFNGLIDGMSMGQSPGDLRMQLIVKSKYQLLKEINPKWAGYHPAGVDFTKRVDVLKLDQTDEGLLNSVSIQVMGSMSGLDLKVPIVDAILKVINAFVDSQVNWEYTISSATADTTTLVNSMKQLRLTHLMLAKKLLASIDTSYAKTDLNLGDPQALQVVMEMLCSTRNNLFDLLVGMLQEVGCSLVIADDKAFVVPSSGFLKITHPAQVGFRQISTLPNVVFPAQYTNFSFNDNGYKDISAVYVMSDSNNSWLVDALYPETPAEKALEKNTAGVGGILGITMPKLLMFNNSCLAATRIAVEHKRIAQKRTNTYKAEIEDYSDGSWSTEAEQFSRLNNLSDKEEAAIKEDQAKASKKMEAEIMDKARKFSKNYAKLMYYEYKYTDRSGGFIVSFNPKFAPGAVGSIYQRYPGVYTDFYLLEVSHEIRVSAPNSGTATTTVNFNCGRMGSLGSSLLGSGLDKLDLFNDYTAVKSFDYASKFVGDIIAV